MKLRLWTLLLIISSALCLSAWDVNAHDCLQTTERSQVGTYKADSSFLDIRNKNDKKFEFNLEKVRPDLGIKLDPSRLQRIGGNSGGGGNLDSSKLADASLIEFFTRQQLPKLLKMVFNYGFDPALDKYPKRFAGIKPSDSILDGYSVATATKLYNGKENVFDKLGSVRIDVKHGDCYDPRSGEARDGSATADGICISSGRLANRYTISEYQKYILALVVHEYSHLLGTTESEAEFLERSVISFVKLDGTVSNSLDSRLFDIQILHDEVQERILSAQDEHLSSSALCLRLQRIRSDVSSLREETYRFSERYGMSILSPSQEGKIWSAVLKALNLTAYCNATPLKDDLEKDQMIDLFLANESEVDISVIRSRTSIPNHGEKGATLRLSGGNRTSVVEELKDISVLLKSVLKSSRDN